MGWVHHGDGMHVGQQFVIDLPGVGGHFDHQGIVGGEGLAAPGLQVGPGQAARAVDLFTGSIHGDGDQVVLVDIKTKKTSGGWFFCKHGGILLNVPAQPEPGRPGTFYFWAEVTHTDTGLGRKCAYPSLVEPNGLAKHDCGLGR